LWRGDPPPCRLAPTACGTLLLLHPERLRAAGRPSRSGGCARADATDRAGRGGERTAVARRTLPTTAARQRLQQARRPPRGALPRSPSAANDLGGGAPRRPRLSPHPAQRPLHAQPGASPPDREGLPAARSRSGWRSSRVPKAVGASRQGGGSPRHNRPLPTPMRGKGRFDNDRPEARHLVHGQPTLLLEGLGRTPGRGAAARRGLS